jgi:hypothetical protein
MNRNSRDHIKTRPIPTIFSRVAPLFLDHAADNGVASAAFLLLLFEQKTPHSRFHCSSILGNFFTFRQVID